MLKSREEYFSVNNIEKAYNKKIQYETRNDKAFNYNYFRKNKDEIFEKMSYDLLNNKYQLSNYSIALIPKDVNKLPRKICIPIIRDKVLLEILKQILYDIFDGIVLCDKIGVTVEKFIETYRSKSYKYFIYVDIEHFYDSISHRKLLNKIKKITNEEWITNLLLCTLKNRQKYKKIIKNNKGVPQGLSISNFLANIYMDEFDSKIKKKNDIVYVRYVDDIFIFHNYDDDSRLYNYVDSNLKKLGLKVNSDKKLSGRLYKKDDFDFLGYTINNNLVYPKKDNIKKFEMKLEGIFKSFYYSEDKNLDYLKWMIDLQVTGAIIDDKKYGWLYYFSHMTDISSLYHLDNLIEKFSKRYKVEKIKFKTFKKAYKEIKYGKPNESKYLLNINKLSSNDKCYILGIITKYDKKVIESFSIDKLDYLFKRYMYKDIRSLEKDLDSLS